MLIIAGVSVGYKLLETYRDAFQNENGSLVTQVKSPPSSNAKFEILDSPPQINYDFLMDYDPLSEDEVFRFADISMTSGNFNGKDLMPELYRKPQPAKLLRLF